MKRLIALALTLVFVLAGCSNAAETKDPLAGWLEAANLDAEETPEQLYAAAQKEDMLVIYSTSTRMFDVAESFEAEYPGLIVQVVHIRESELYKQLEKNYETGNFACDLIYSADGRGIMEVEYVPKNIAVKYTPYDIADKILPGYNETLLTLTGEASVLCYNEQCYPEPPVHNWWELTEEKWRGMVYMPNLPLSMTTLAFFNMMVKNSDVMAEAYEDLYGQPLILPEGENAGREFVRRLIRNGAHIVNSSDETAEAIGAPGSSSPNLGILISSKTRLRSLGYEMVNHYEMEPFCGVYTPSTFMMAGGAKNVNAAKLYTRWVLGEADGQGEGYRPYVQSGAWTVRSDVQDDTGVNAQDLNLWQIDKPYLYENYEPFLAVWESLLAEREQ